MRHVALYFLLALGCAWLLLLAFAAASWRAEKHAQATSRHRLRLVRAGGTVEADWDQGDGDAA